MKKAFLALAIIIPLCSYGNSKKEKIIFEPQYIPETTYTQTTENTVDIVMTISASKSMAELLELTEKNMTSTSTEVEVTESIVKTGRQTDDEYFPFKLEIIKSTHSDDTPALPEGTIAYGYCYPGEMPVFDSLSMDTNDEELIEETLTAAQEYIDEISYPEPRELKVGETFTEKEPLSFPVSGFGNVTISIITTYKLLRVKNGLACFSITATFSANSDVKNAFKVSGNGKGSFVYDVSNKFYTDYQLYMNAKIKMEIYGIKIDALMKNNYKQVTQISDNKGLLVVK